MYITKRITISVHATADDWQLYDLPGREDAAIALNQRFEELVNKGATRSEVRNGMCLSDYANLAQRTPKSAISSRIFWTGHSGNNEPLRTMPRRCGHGGIAGCGIEELKGELSRVREF